MTQDQWDEFLKRSKGWSIMMSFELLHSEAYKKLNYGPALKVLNWFHEKIRLEKIEGKRGKNRYRRLNNGVIDFPYREAVYRGLSPQRFSKALKVLHRFGFIDVIKPGSALKGDNTQFILSDRWKAWGSRDFKEVNFPRSVCWRNFGFGSKEREHKKVRCENSHLYYCENSHLKRGHRYENSQ